jgi:hypothetical protein
MGLGRKIDPSRIFLMEQGIDSVEVGICVGGPGDRPSLPEIPHASFEPCAGDPRIRFLDREASNSGALGSSGYKFENNSCKSGTEALLRTPLKIGPLKERGE